MSTKKEKSEQYFDSIAGNYDNSRDGKFVKGMYQELIARIEAKKGERNLFLTLDVEMEMLRVCWRKKRTQSCMDWIYHPI